MCGRASQKGKREDFRNYVYKFEAPEDLSRGNIRPTDPVLIVANDREDIKTVEAKWWCQPDGSREWTTKYTAFNANIEKLETSSLWKNLLKQKRCIMPVSSFYEWPEKGNPPVEIFANGGHPFGLAGLWSSWHDGSEWKRSFAVITTQANEFMKQYHHAMPVVLEDKDLQKSWLLDGGMDILRGFECDLYGDKLTHKLEVLYPDAPV